MGGWTALDLDFRRRAAYEGGSEKHTICRSHSTLIVCWAQLFDQSLLLFYVFGYFSKEERRGENISEYLRSMKNTYLHLGCVH